MTSAQHHPRGTGHGPGRTPGREDRRPGAPRAATAAEQARIADDLHAGLAQGLTALSMQAALLSSLQASPERADAEHRIRGMAEQALIDVRRLLTVLRGTDRAAADPPSELLSGGPLDPAAAPEGWAWDVTGDDLHALSPSIRVAVLRLLEHFAALARDPQLVDGVVRLGRTADGHGPDGSEAGADPGRQDRVVLTLVARRDPSHRTGLRGLEDSLRPRAAAYGGECVVQADADRIRLQVLLPLR